MASNEDARMRERLRRELIVGKVYRAAAEASLSGPCAMTLLAIQFVEE